MSGESNLENDEEVLEFQGIGRSVVGLTSQRFLVSNFPFFSAPKVLVGVPYEEIKGLDFQVKSHKVVLQVTSDGRVNSVPLSGGFQDVPAMLKEIFGKIRERNPSVGGPAYFEEGEKEISSLGVKGGMFRITDRNVYIVGDKVGADGRPAELEKVALTDVTQFDFYEGAMGSLLIFLESPAGKHNLKIGSLSSTSKVSGVVGVHDEEWLPERMARQMPQARPGYLEGEDPLFTVRAAKSKVGAIKPKYHARLTGNRLLLLVPGKDGALVPEKVYERGDLGNPRITRHKGQHGEVLNFEAAFPNGLKIFVPSENETPFQGIMKALS